MANMDCYLELTLDVEYSYTPAGPVPHGEPPEEAEIEINSVILRNYHTLVKIDIQAYLTPWELGMLEDQIIDSMPGPDDIDGEY